jgi:predicted aspartyl protease
VRRVEVDALVDTGATYPALPKDLIERLGLPEL